MTSLCGVVPAIIDSHIHQWDVPRTSHEQKSKARLYQAAPRLIERIFPLVSSRADREFVRTPRHVMRPYLPATFAVDQAEAFSEVGVGIDGVIHVEAGWHGDPVKETAWLSSLPFGEDGAPQLRGIVAYADPTSKEVAEVLDRHLATSSLVRGIRCMGAWHPDPGIRKYAKTEGLFREADFLIGFEAIAERGLTFDAYVYSHQLGDVAILAREYPETTIVLDHYGPPVGWGGRMGDRGQTAESRSRLFADWRDSISDLASHSNVAAKHSGLAFPMLGLPKATYSRDQLAETMRPLVDHTQDAFGEDRVMFGSNFPMDKALSSYGAIVGALTDIVAPRGHQALIKAFRANAERLYGLCGPISP